MGKVFSIIQRRANRFNVENRAHKVISKDKPVPAPKYPSTVQEIEAIKSEYPHALEEQYKKDSKLDNRLKEVYVSSHDPEVIEEPLVDSSRPLPQNRSVMEDPEWGYIEPVMIPQGRFTLKQAVKFIADHQADPNTWTAAAIAKEYSIEQDKLEKILFHYRAFNIHIPESKDKKSSKKVSIETEKPKQLLESQEEKVPHQDGKQ